MTHPNQPCVLMFKGRGLVSACIQWQTRGPYSHVGVLRPDGRVIESWQGKGVRVTDLEDWRQVDRYHVVGITETQWAVALEFMHAQLGKGYDYWAICRFISRRLMPENDRWFCSELVFSALSYAGVRLLHRVSPSEVSPSMMSLSPLLTPDPIPSTNPV